MHIFHIQDGLGYIECSSDDEEKYGEHICWRETRTAINIGSSPGFRRGSSPLDRPSRFDPKRNARLSFLQSCRRM
jgi:hypothetical protein